MPRKAPSNVDEVRHTFGNLERKHLAELTEAQVKATKLKSYASVAGNLGLLAIGGGVVATAAFFGIGYAGSTLKDLVEPVVDWGREKSASIAGGENVEKIEARILYEEQQVAKWDAEAVKMAQSGNFKAAGIAKWKATNHRRKLEMQKRLLVLAKKQQDLNKSGVPTSLLELLGGQGNE